MSLFNIYKTRQQNKATMVLFTTPKGSSVYPSEGPLKVLRSTREQRAFLEKFEVKSLEVKLLTMRRTLEEPLFLIVYSNQYVSTDTH